MQTRIIINKIRWIRSQLSDELEKWMFSVEPPDSVNPIGYIHDASRFAEVVSRDAAAVDILRVFGLNFLTDRKTMLIWLDGHVGTGSRGSPDDSMEQDVPLGIAPSQCVADHDWFR